MTDLTEQWKNKQLEWHKSYYCRNKKGDVCIATLMGDDTLYSQELGGTLNFGYWEVLAPVPSYEELQEKQKSLKVLAEAYCKEKEENQQLRQLLKECKPYFDALLEKRLKLEYIPQVYELLTKIDNAIGEKK